MTTKALAVQSPIRALRVMHGLTQEQLGAVAGVSKQIICRWEKGAPPKLWSRLARIANALDVSADELLGRAKPTPVVDAINAQDRKLLDLLEQHALALFGPEMLARAGGWRRIASYSWMGHLRGAIDRMLAMPSTPPAYTGPIYPENWFEGWESPVQEARRLNKPEPKQRRLPKGGAK